jgi:DNA-directed RNA polymerase specialized sigma24 family protein
MSDEPVLVERIRRRDPVALGLYIEARRDALMAYIERQLGAALRRKVEPEDILQEVGVEAVRVLPSIELEGREPLAWLCQIAERRIIDAHRRFFDAQKRATSVSFACTRQSKSSPPIAATRCECDTLKGCRRRRSPKSSAKATARSA